MTKTVLLNAKLIKPDSKPPETCNLLLANGKLIGMGYIPDEAEDSVHQIDLQGCWIVPNIIDSFVQGCEPGFENRDNLDSVSTAAASAGITGLISSPETYPVCDTPEMIQFILNRATSATLPVYPLGGVTKQLQGSELAEMGLMKKAGAVGFTDGAAIISPSMMQNALAYSAMFGTPILSRPHSHNPEDGVMNDGYQSTILGLKGVSSVIEETLVARDIQLAEKTGGKLHIFPITTRGSVKLIRDAKQRGIQVTCGTAPHYLYLTDQDLEGYDTAKKANPPFRTSDDQAALIDGIKDGTIDILASDHQPHTIDDKRTDFTSAAFGISGVDLFLPLILNNLYHQHKIDPSLIFKLISTNPARLFSLSLPKLLLGSAPNFTIIDPAQDYTVTQDSLLSNGKNTPFIGQTLKGGAKITVVNGKFVSNVLPFA